ncbi:chorismate--pyruvate lyase family protein [Larsenimonas rhizosphaerae]|uniref:chorismate--pyruvate lyase family protein n=1 Tax=Larsenimonas rhizosphaerae TaxID=2944682 RepID=UPI0020344C71|nr:chorismate lyase [Larsenimonas rhizosphaerae]MCM2131226.1 chorismate lyase [Larsenimonas rhizosphaerae]
MSFFTRWRPVTPWPPSVPRAWQPWLASTDSLTARLSSAMPAPLSVVLTHEGTGLPAADEQHRLKQSGRRYMLTREVLLCCGHTPWVAARSVALLTPSAQQLLAGMGRTPLGHWLFTQPDTVRSSLEMTLSACSSTASPDLQPLVGRRSVFTHPRITLLVQEFFLPPMGMALALPPPGPMR